MERGWRALVRLPKDQVAPLDEHLWTFRDESFLPHGRDDEPMAAYQPVVLSSEVSSAQGFDAVFLIGSETLIDMGEAKRCLIMINGRSEADTQASRTYWKALKDAGEDISYWQQGAGGRWEKKA